MKSRKSQSPSNIIAEMLKALPDQCSQLIADLINAKELNSSYIGVCLKVKVVQ